MKREVQYKRLRFFNWWLDDVWYIGCRRVSQNMICGYDSATFYKLLSPTYRYWFADPIPCVIDGKCYIFMEVYDRFTEKGHIGVSRVNNKTLKIDRPVNIIEEEFHMSFPFVFYYKANIYMIPETHEVKQIRIYKMGESVYKWNLYHVYDTNEELSDTIVLLKDETIYLLNTEKNKKNPYQTKMHFFRIDNLLNKSALIEIPLNISAPDWQEYRYNNRNGGMVVKDKDRIYRIIQEAEDWWYGKDIVVREIQNYSDEGYDESEDIQKLEMNEIPVKIRKNHEILGIHTYGYEDGFEVIDINVRQLSWVVFWQFVQRNINKVKRGLELCSMRLKENIRR